MKGFDGVFLRFGGGRAYGVRTKEFESRSCRRNSFNKFVSKLDMLVPCEDTGYHTYILQFATDWNPPACCEATRELVVYGQDGGDPDAFF